MRYDLEAAQEAARDRARQFARERVQSEAAGIDRTSAIPQDLVRDATAVLAENGGDMLSVVLVIEALASASGSLALAVSRGTSKSGAPLDLPGLRGATRLDDGPRTQLLLAAVAVGLGQAALDAALADLRRAAATPGASNDKPHWAVADAATTLEAARLLTYKAAAAERAEGAETAIAVARLLALAAARDTVDVALRVGGAEGYRPGGLLERLTRDVRALSLLLGTEEQLRAKAAEDFLPS